MEGGNYFYERPRPIATGSLLPCDPSYSSRLPLAVPAFQDFNCSSCKDFKAAKPYQAACLRVKWVQRVPERNDFLQLLQFHCFPVETDRYFSLLTMIEKSNKHYTLQSRYNWTYSVGPIRNFRIIEIV